MLKCVGAFLVPLFVSASLSAQGTVNFNTQLVGARVYCSISSFQNNPNDPTGAIAGNAFGAQLYSAPGTISDESALHAIGGRVNFRTGVNAGYVQVALTAKNKWGEPINPAVRIPGTIDADGSRQATIQMRVWESAFETYDDALARGGRIGRSNMIRVDAGFPPNTPPNLTGLKSFYAGYLSGGDGCVPEPSAVALAALGVGLLFASRRIPKQRV